MSKNRQRQRKRQVKTKQASGPAPREPITRRRVLGWLRTGAIASAIIVVGGYYSTRSVQATMAEQDLTRIGQGKPTIVQIHDPNCGLCRNLQSATRAALRKFDDEDVTYLVANIKNPEGSAFALKHRVAHVTLLLMDGQGEVLDVLEGVRGRRELESAFERTLRLQPAG